MIDPAAVRRASGMHHRHRARDPPAERSRVRVRRDRSRSTTGQDPAVGERVRPQVNERHALVVVETDESHSHRSLEFERRKRERDIGDCCRQSEYEEPSEHCCRVELDQQIESALCRHAMRASQRGRCLAAEQVVDTVNGESGQSQIGSESLDQLGSCVQLRSGIHSAIQSCLGLRDGNDQSWGQRTAGLCGHPRLHVVRRSEARQPRVERGTRRVPSRFSSRPLNSGSPPSIPPTCTPSVRAKRSWERSFANSLSVRTL